jgi:hypothetical protein
MPTTTISINTGDRRDVRALRILQGARSWSKMHVNIPGVGVRKAYGIRSESEPLKYHIVNRRQCSCSDFQFRQDGGTFACAHMRAVRWYCEIVMQERRKKELQLAQEESERVKKANEDARQAEECGNVDAF